MIKKTHQGEEICRDLGLAEDFGEHLEEFSVGFHGSEKLLFRHAAVTIHVHLR